MDKHEYAVIMAGGSGERFWPLSTGARPKQFVTLFGGKPLIRHAVDRLEGLVPPERILIVTSAALAAASREACGNLPPENVIGEPCRRDTAAACALSCGLVAARDPEGVAAILTADQIMADAPAFRQILADSFAAAAASDAIVTIGVEPDHPATGFGYIEGGESVDFGTATRFLRARRFVEKPDAETARRYLAAGNYRWNAGMFIWRVRTMRAAISAHAPDLLPLVDVPAKASSPSALDAALAELYPTLRKISVDYAVMEKCSNIVMATGAFGWDDVGSWPSIEKHFDRDADGNVAIGRVESLDSARNIVVSHGGDGRLVALLGCEDMVVVQTEKATLICPKAQSQRIKELVRQLGGRADGADYV